MDRRAESSASARPTVKRGPGQGARCYIAASGRRCYDAPPSDHESSHPRRRRGDAPAPPHPLAPRSRWSRSSTARSSATSSTSSPRAGVREVVFSVAYRPERVEAVFGDGSGLGVRIRYAVEDDARSAPAARCATPLPLLDERTIVLNGDVLTDVDLAAVVARHEAEGASATIVLTPVPNPAAYGLVETDPQGRVLRFLEKPQPRADHDQHHQRRRLRARDAGCSSSMPPGVQPLDRAGLLPRPPRPRRPGARARCTEGYWIDIGTPEKYLQVHRDILRRPLPGGPRRGAAGGGLRPPHRPRVRRGEPLDGPFYVGPGLRGRGRARALGPDAVLVADVRVRAGRLGPRQRPVAGASRRRPTPTSSGSLVGPGVRLGRSSVLRGRRPRRGLGPQRLLAHPLTPRRMEPMPPIDPGIFKAYDIRGLYPVAARRRGRPPRRPRLRRLPRRPPDRGGPGLPAVLARARRRRSSRAPARRAREVTDIGVVGTDMLYYYVARHDLDGGADRHRLPQPEGVERDQAGAARGPRPLRRRRDQGDPRVGRRRAATPTPRRPTGEPRTARRRARGLRAPLPVLRATPAAIPRLKVVLDTAQRHGRGGRARRSSSTCRSTPSACTSTSTAPSPTTPPTPWSRRTAATSWRGCWPRAPTWASPGTATPTAASSSTTPGSTCRATS